MTFLLFKKIEYPSSTIYENFINHHKNILLSYYLNCIVRSSMTGKRTIQNINFADHLLINMFP